MTTREPQSTAAVSCQKCKHQLVGKSKFCDSCGNATTSLVSDWETLQHYCGRCGSMLRGAKKYCSSCGDASPHSGRKRVKHDHWFFQAAEDPKIQIGAVLLLVLFASLPVVLPVHYGLTTTPPFFLIFDETQVAQRASAPLAGATWSARPLISADELSGGTPITAVAGLTQDALGNYFLSDPAQHAIYRITREGVRELVAGGGEPGFSGDGGQATQAQLNTPLGLAADPYGNLYVADTGNGRIRVIDVDGIIRTIAGCGVDCGQRTAGPAAALTVGMRPAQLTFVGKQLLVTEQPDADSNSKPAAWILQPGS